MSVSLTTSIVIPSKVPFLKRKRILIPTIVLLAILVIVGWIVSPIFIDVIVNEPFPFSTTNNSKMIASGQFVGQNRGSGDAIIFQQGNERILRLEDFDVANGPVLQVLLVEDTNGASNQTFGDYVDLGLLKGNIGNQNYSIPSDVDLSRYSGVVIYCELFHTVFSTASFDI